MRLAQKAFAFVRRDFLIESSYKFAFVFELLTAIFPAFSFYFIGKLVDGTPRHSLAKYGGMYFPFVMIGIALTQYFMLALRTFATTIRRSQMAGCLEATLSTQTRPEIIIIFSSLYSFSSKLFHVLVIFAVGWLFLGVNYRRTNFLCATVVLALTVLAFSGLGMFSAAIIVVLKKGEPIEWIFGSVSSLLGGALFPVDVMPMWMQKASALLPITHSLEAMRMAILRGGSLASVWRQVAILGAMAAVLLPLSLWCFSIAVAKGRRDGSLVQY